jgi:hypothetical protein
VAIRQQPWGSLLWGLVVLIVTPVALAILAVTIIGIPLALIGVAIYVIEIYLAKIFTALAIGDLAADPLKISDNRYLRLAVGLVIYFALGALPIVGGFVRFVGLLFGLGAVFIAKRDYFTTKRGARAR